jgi:hypothetical protein
MIAPKKGIKDATKSRSSPIIMKHDMIPDFDPQGWRLK